MILFLKQLRRRPDDETNNLLKNQKARSPKGLTKFKCKKTCSSPNRVFPSAPILHLLWGILSFVSCRTLSPSSSCKFLGLCTPETWLFLQSSNPSIASNSYPNDPPDTDDLAGSGSQCNGSIRPSITKEEPLQ